MNKLPPHLKKPNRNKYRNKKTVVGGIKFDSKKEAARWADLQRLERAGLISGLERQVKIYLMGANGPILTKTGRKMRYIADFTYTDTETGEDVIEDVKGYKTKEYEIKRAIIRAMGLEIKET